MQRVNGKLQFEGWENSVTPEPTDLKFGTYDYVGDFITYALIIS